MWVCAVLMRLLMPSGVYPRGRNQDSCTLLPESCRYSVRILGFGRFITYSEITSCREPAGRLRPRQLHRPHAMHRALASRWIGVQKRLVLAGVQVTPLSLRRMVVLPTGPPALRARPLLHIAVSQVNVNFTSLQLQIHPPYSPRRLDIQYAPIQLMILHPAIVVLRLFHPLQSRNSLFHYSTMRWNHCSWSDQHQHPNVSAHQ